MQRRRLPAGAAAPLRRRHSRHSRQPSRAAAKPAAEAEARCDRRLRRQLRPQRTPAASQVQLASVRSPEAAREEWDRLKRENPDLLGKLTAIPVRADLGDKGVYYRIQAGPFADAAAAERICGELKRRNIGCILAR